MGHIQRMCWKREQIIDLDGIVACSVSDDFGKTERFNKEREEGRHEMRRQSDDVESLEGRHGERRGTTWREKRDDMERED